MKVGIDGVLLGAWTNTENAYSILDIGTGSGLISLMLAQNSKAVIDAIDIDKDAVLQASQNIEQSPWSKQIKVYETSLQKYAEKSSVKYDLIVSNPPYFVNSTKAPKDNRTIARHTDCLSHEELLDNALLLLKPTGRISIILPVSEGLQCVDYATNIGLKCSKKVSVYPKPGALAKRLLLEFDLFSTVCISSEITIEGTSRHQYTPEFTNIVKDYYLKL